MITSVHAVAAAAQQVPGYCTSGHGILTATQWKTCWDLGWSQPVNSTVGHAGNAVGSAGGAVLLLLIGAVVGLILLSRRGSRAPVTSK